METIIKLQPSELKDAIVEKVLNFIKNRQDTEVTISVKTISRDIKAISGKAYLDDLSESIKQLENKENLIGFTYEEFIEFSKALSEK